jgi:hypothetical protein
MHMKEIENELYTKFNYSPRFFYNTTASSCEVIYFVNCTIKDLTLIAIQIYLNILYSIKIDKEMGCSEQGLSGGDYYFSHLRSGI